ncbi:MAG: hypothetical protein AAFO02_12215, partial [Bacteroidota bacterium]
MKHSTFCARLTCLSLAILFFSYLPAQVRFEADFNTRATGSSPLWITTVGDRIFFSADDGVTGREPWIYSPSVDQSFRLRDINAGSAGSFPWEVSVINEAAYFVAQNELEEQLWVLPPGTNTVEQIPTDSTLSEIRSLTHYDDAIYFRAKHLGDTQGNIYLYRYLLSEDRVEEVINTNPAFNLNSSFPAMGVHSEELYLQGSLFDEPTQVLLRYSSATDTFELVENQYTTNGNRLQISDFRSLGDYLVMTLRNPLAPSGGHLGVYESGSDSIFIDLSIDLETGNPPGNRTIEVLEDRLFLLVEDEPNAVLRSYDLASRTLEEIPGVDESGAEVVHMEIMDGQLLYFLRVSPGFHRMRQLDPATDEITVLPNLSFLSQSSNGPLPGSTFNVFAELDGVWYTKGAGASSDSELFFLKPSDESRGQLTDIHKGNRSGSPFVMRATSDGRLLVRANFEEVNSSEYRWVDYDAGTQTFAEVMPEVEWDSHSKLYSFSGYLVATHVNYEGVLYDAVAFDSMTESYIPIIEYLGSCGGSPTRASGTFVAYDNAIYFTHCDGEEIQLYRHEIGVAGATAISDFSGISLVRGSLVEETMARLGGELIIPVGENPSGLFRFDLYRFDGNDFVEIDLSNRAVRGVEVLESPAAVYFTVVNDSGSLNVFQPAYVSADNPAEVHFLTYQGDTIRQVFGAEFHLSDSSVYFVYQGEVLRHHPSSEEAELYYSLPDTSEDVESPFILDGRLLYTATTSAFGRELYEVTDLGAEPNRVTDIRLGSLDSDIVGMTALNNRLFFSADDGLRGEELWSFSPGCFTLTLSSTPSGIDLPTGEVVATPNGGTAPFTYQWSNGASTAVLSEISAGFYEVTVTDAGGCSVSEYGWVETNGIISSSKDQDLAAPRITVYPNPFRDQLSLQLEEVAPTRMMVRLFSLRGQL